MVLAAASLRASRVPPELTGISAAHASGAVAAALATLDALDAGGWRALVDQPLGIRANVGADAVAERSETFDPLALEAHARR
jgi:hypothetical protein